MKPRQPGFLDRLESLPLLGVEQSPLPSSQKPAHSQLNSWVGASYPLLPPLPTAAQSGDAGAERALSAWRGSAFRPRPCKQGDETEPSRGEGRAGGDI